jgi:pimeloyl-ACP methyl ester carboxylesterase
VARAVIDRIALEYDDSGDGEPVVFIHGAFIADAFRPLLSEPVLAERYRLISYHRRGYGGSSPPREPMTFAIAASDCSALLSHLGVRRAHVVGHSYGANVSLQLALQAPGLVHSLSLLEAGLMVGESAPLYRQAGAKPLALRGRGRARRR